MRPRVRLSDHHLQLFDSSFNFSSVLVCLQ
jgi:hypothetical protein